MRRSTCTHPLAGVLIFFILAGLPLGGFADDMAMTAATTVTNSTAVSPPATNAPAVAVVGTPIAAPGTIYTLKVNSLTGTPVDLNQYAGHVALVVNSASKSFSASQLLGLEKLYENYKDRGFVVLDFPCNDFGRLEPGTPQETATAYAAYNLTFPIFEKVTLHGSGQSPVYQCLMAGRETPTWNFHKYLVDKTGKVIGEFPTLTTADNKDLLAAIEAALK
jgi:glutathione peroxidase